MKRLEARLVAWPFQEHLGRPVARPGMTMIWRGLTQLRTNKWVWYTMMLSFIGNNYFLLSLISLLHCLLNQSGRLQNQNLRSPDEIQTDKYPQSLSLDRKQEVGTGIIRLFLHYGCRIVILKLNYNEIPFAPDYGVFDNPNARYCKIIYIWLVLARVHGAVLARTDPSQIQRRHRSHAGCWHCLYQRQPKCRSVQNDAKLYRTCCKLLEAAAQKPYH